MARLKVLKTPYFCSTTRPEGTTFASGNVDGTTDDWRTGNETLGSPANVSAIHEFAWSHSIFIRPKIKYRRSDGWRSSTCGASLPLLSNTAQQAEFDLLYNRCLGDLNEQVRGSLDLSIDAFQLGATADLGRYVTQFSKQTAQFFQGLRRSTVKTISSKYLEYIYGVKPTMQSIYGIYNKVYNHAGIPLRVRTRSSSRYDYSGSYAESPPFGLTGSWATRKYKGTLNTRCEVCVEFKTRQLSAIQSLAGWTSLNPVSIAYELLPYSFVWDWIIDVGGYIRNFESYLVYNNLYSKGWYTWTNLSQTSSSGLFPISGVVITDDSGGNTEQRYKWRRPLNSYPMPVRPRLNCNLGSQRLLNAAALLGNLLPKK